MLEEASRSSSGPAQPKVKVKLSELHIQVGCKDVARVLGTSAVVLLVVDTWHANLLWITLCVAIYVHACRGGIPTQDTCETMCHDQIAARGSHHVPVMTVRLPDMMCVHP